LSFRSARFLGRLLYGFLPTGGGRTAELIPTQWDHDIMKDELA
jgi:hypothetical protein